ncbi:MAG TPA: outer membrane beta-barrel protein [Pyrinomonadaceae bacterium]|nr:outer membrane beta-barrel protein [Pyrinomonadaceae bacterium]
MRRLFLAALLLACCAPAAWAQSTDEYPKVTFFAGYSFDKPDVNNSGAPNLHGFDTQVTGHLNKYFGVKGDFSAHFGSEGENTNIVCVQAPCPTFKVKNRLYQFLGGPEVRARNSSKVTPFAHVLVGAAHLRNSISGTFIPNGITATITRFALAAGGGVDVRANDRIDIRIVQVEYNPIFFQGSTSNGVRISTGIVFK